MNRRRYAVTLIAALAIVVTVPGLGLAAQGGGKPGGGGGGTGSSVTLVPLYTHPGGPVIGDQITFSVVSSVETRWVTAACYQNNSLVYSETRGFYSGYPWGTTYTLGPTYKWTGGSASCKADLFTVSKNRNVILATTTFSVSG